MCYDILKLCSIKVIEATACLKTTTTTEKTTILMGGKASNSICLLPWQKRFFDVLGDCCCSEAEDRDPQKSRFLKFKRESPSFLLGSFYGASLSKMYLTSYTRRPKNSSLIKRKGKAALHLHYAEVSARYGPMNV